MIADAAQPVISSDCTRPWYSNSVSVSASALLVDWNPDVSPPTKNSTTSATP